MATRPVMVIGLDGLTLDILLPLVDAGELPTFAYLLQTGTYGTLRSVTNMTTGPTWASFATGCRPRTHGIVHDFHHSADGYSLTPTKGRDIQTPAFWSIAGDAGHYVIVLNVPITYPVTPLNGVMLAGIDAPSERAAGFAYPSDAYDELRQAGCDYIIDCGLASYMQQGNVAGGRAAVARETEGRTRAAEYFMQRYDWSLFVTVYSLPDVWQHYYWSAPPGTPEREQLHDGYRMMDTHLCRLLDHLPDDGIVILCSDHGFGPLRGTRDFVNRWLEQRGWLKYNSVGQRSPMSRLFGGLLSLVRQRLSFRRRQQLLALVPPFRRLVETQLRIGDIEWKRTHVYAALDHLELWVNMAGRQPHGRVPADEYDSFCDELETALRNWCDPSGIPYIAEVERQPYAGADITNALPPDVALRWSSDARPPAPLHPLITGDHARDGTLIISGKGMSSRELPSHSLIDIAPLALYALGVDVPAEMEGDVPPVIQRL